MRVEAITVCIGYGDFLKETARANRSLVDDLVVVTSPDDHETRGVCKEMSIRHVLSEEHRRDGPFNKARLIQRALDQIGARDWILHLDADVVLPRGFRRYLDWAHLDERTIYGADRCNVVGWDAWRAFATPVDGTIIVTAAYSVSMMRDPLADATYPGLHGYVPIGFFQLWHGSAMIDRGFHQKRYPLNHGDAARTDVQFALQWDRRYRQLLPEVIVLHLESEQAAQGANWCGRTTRPFGPSNQSVVRCQLSVAKAGRSTGRPVRPRAGSSPSASASSLLLRPAPCSPSASASSLLLRTRTMKSLILLGALIAFLSAFRPSRSRRLRRRAGADWPGARCRIRSGGRGG